MEEWKELDGYHGKYLISNLGRVMSKCRSAGKILKLCDNGWGYYSVFLYRNGVGTHYKVHRLVAQAFVSGYRLGLVVNHIDGKPHNNDFRNLEWVTISENTKHSYRLGLQVVAPKTPNSKVMEIGPRFLSGESPTKIGREYGITANGVRYAAVRYKNIIGRNRSLIFRPEVDR